MYASCLKLLIFYFLLAFASCWGNSASAQEPVRRSARRTVQSYKRKPASATANYPDDKFIAKGKILFQKNCSSCHNFLQRGIGPNLAHVTAEVSPDWLKKFISNAPARINQGDGRAVRLLEEYKQLMPAFPTLTEFELNALLAYLQANHKPQSLAPQPGTLGVGLKNPVPAKPIQSGLKLRLSEVLTAPATAKAAPRARINKMVVLPGLSGQDQPDRVFIQDLRGTLYELLDNKLRIFMDIRKQLSGFVDAPGLGTGFGSVAFHPDFYQNGLFYTTHNENAGAAPAGFTYPDSIHVTLQGVVTEWKMRSPAESIFSGTRRELMRINFVSAIHGLQEISFNPMARPGSDDYGLLYIGVGDGGATEEGYYGLCKDETQIWGSVVRIDPLGTNIEMGSYKIPPGNPYANDQNPATLGEIFCRGFRNPNRISWTYDGKMLITDIGQHNAEEVNFGMKGADYGWPEREGTFRINPRGDMSIVYSLPADDSLTTYSYPVIQYDHDEGSAISGGFVYDGTSLPELRGKYIFGDIVNGRIFFVDNKDLMPGVQATIQELELEVDGQVTNFKTLCGSEKTDLRFGIGLHKELYLFTKSDGKIYQATACKH
ncbi:PQQ-dependent sugar dehydrogenase [Dyadobacter diqingensis]|uniref:PQQ-dependent sugar dehydrogenase n=1 Tax=Dyadobacter diqingensis TaxID=2938121 RepID=UPI0021135546|nr:PQQ-dependent sugar dehydrogenase [Dyadobacter diqingensis]